MPVKFSDFSSAGGDGNWDGVFFFFSFLFFALHAPQWDVWIPLLPLSLCHPPRTSDVCVHQGRTKRAWSRSEVCCPSRALIRLDVQELRCTAVWIQGWRLWCLPAREWRWPWRCAFVCIMHFLLWLNEDLNNLGHYFNILGFLLKELAAVPEVEQNTLSVLLLFTCCRVNGPLCNRKKLFFAFGISTVGKRCVLVLYSTKGTFILIVRVTK